MLETKRLYLKEYDSKYIDELHTNVFGSTKTAKYVLWRPTQNKEDVKDKLEYWLYQVKVKFLFIAHKKDTDEPIGFISVDEIESNVYGNLGITIGEKFINLGYGSEVLEALIEHIRVIGGKEIHYSHFKENDASRKLALKCGFKFYKKAKRIRKYDGREFDELFYILRIRK